jgi:hypothetical protein
MAWRLVLEMKEAVEDEFHFILSIGALYIVFLAGLVPQRGLLRVYGALITASTTNRLAVGRRCHGRKLLGVIVNSWKP